MKILLVGAGGYAGLYVNALLDIVKTDKDVKWEGIVDPFYASCALKEKIDAANIPVYKTMEEFYSEHTADLAVICTPSYLHKEQSIFAVKHGSNVLCEKPAAPTVDEVLQMQNAEKEFKRFIAIGYQWSFSDAILSLKNDILSGLLGSPVYMKTAISWPRNKAYYNRGSKWAGKIIRDGRLVLDSIASNACAHYLHNMFFLLGDTMESSIDPIFVEADCMRANEIENFDTCSARIKTKKAELYFIASHATEKLRDPEFVYTFENATVTFGPETGNVIKAKFSNGIEKVYGNPFENDRKKLADSIAAVKEGRVPICTVTTALAHVRLIGMLYDNVEIAQFEDERIKTNLSSDAVYVEGLFEDIYKAYETGKLLSEI